MAKQPFPTLKGQDDDAAMEYNLVMCSDMFFLWDAGLEINFRVTDQSLKLNDHEMLVQHLFMIP
eukprot:6402897-Amphidinium_carterae.1